MIGFAGKLGAGVAIAAAIGIGAAPAGATTLPLEPTAVETAEVEPVFAPETGSAGIYNGIMCQLHTISASVPCMYT
ncbi:hypothetical protein [Nocardia sp. NPDC057440]|uniref:hypothetical protein n=1 Tax=Nocardia sp. NPDC057440 TaxID=3346134 RepID=UPI00366DD3B9